MHGGNLFTSLASLGARVLPSAMKAISKAVPAFATGTVTELGETGLNKIFGNGITIPKKFIAILPLIKVTRPSFFWGGTILLRSSLVSPPLLLS